jgi:hypothetical protein
VGGLTWAVAEMERRYPRCEVHTPTNYYYYSQPIRCEVGRPKTEGSTEGLANDWRRPCAAIVVEPRLIIFRLTCGLDCNTTPPRSHATFRIMSEERRPRSRFDSDDADRPVRSRFDSGRRSRSPTRRESESSHRARSPVARQATDSPAAANLKAEAAAKAAAAAARINAQIAAKKGIQHVDVPPIRAVRLPICTALACTLLTRPRCILLQSSGPRLRLLVPTRPQTMSTSKMETTSKTLRSMICVTAIH